MPVTHTRRFTSGRILILLPQLAVVSLVSCHASPPNNAVIPGGSREIATLVGQRWTQGHVWIGHSWGGKLAVAAAAADARSARGLVLVDAVPASVVPVEPGPIVDRLFAGELDPWSSMEDAVVAAQKLPQYTPWSPDVDIAFRRGVRVEVGGRVVPRLSREMAVAVLGPLFATDLTTTAMQIRVPTLVLSVAGNPEFQNVQRRIFPNANHVTLSGNHWLHISNVDGVAREVLAWLGANQL
jgi:pimeloyl-ACP methyl ester carboxylesterase